jgi:hypothetical protein
MQQYHHHAYTRVRPTARAHTHTNTHKHTGAFQRHVAAVVSLELSHCSAADSAKGRTRGYGWCGDVAPGGPGGGDDPAGQTGKRGADPAVEVRRADTTHTSKLGWSSPLGSGEG